MWQFGAILGLGADLFDSGGGVRDREFGGTAFLDSNRRTGSVLRHAGRCLSIIRWISVLTTSQPSAPIHNFASSHAYRRMV